MADANALDDFGSISADAIRAFTLKIPRKQVWLSTDEIICGSSRETPPVPLFVRKRVCRFWSRRKISKCSLLSSQPHQTRDSKSERQQGHVARPQCRRRNAIQHCLHDPYSALFRDTLAGESKLHAVALYSRQNQCHRHDTTASGPPPTDLEQRLCSKLRAVKAAE
jgi:hypothetical protein